MDISDEIQRRKIDDLIPYMNNPKEHPPEQIDKIASSIKDYGFVQPLVIDEENEIIIGHGRLEAAKKLGLDEVPVVVKDDLNEAQVKALRIADNKVAESEWDYEALATEFDELDFEDFDLDMTGFEDDEIDDIWEDLEPEPEVEEDGFDEEVNEDEPSVTELGDLIELGRHRLVCGDSTSESAVKKLILDNEINLGFHDPPYGIDVVGNQDEKGQIGGSVIGECQKYKPVKGDNEEYDPAHSLQWSDNLVIWGANYFPDKLPYRGQWIVWDKNRPEGTTFSDCELAWTSGEGVAVKKYKCTWNGMTREGENGERVHPTQKPLKLCGDVLNDFSEEGNVILDLFGGSGSTLIACEQLNRKCYMMEIDEHYCDVIIRRYINYRLNNDLEVDVKVNGEKVDYNKYLN